MRPKTRQEAVEDLAMAKKEKADRAASVQAALEETTDQQLTDTSNTQTKEQLEMGISTNTLDMIWQL